MLRADHQACDVGRVMSKSSMTTQDPFHLGRFVEAQAGTYESAIAELRSGRKRSHWMWFVFPQMQGLGHSAMASRYGITGLGEAQAYLAHPVLGARLLECAAALEALDTGDSAPQIFGPTDAMKFRSSLTLFAQVAGPGSIFDRLLDQYFKGQRDDLTLAVLRSRRRPIV
jgi:uncharacterized protein (DUF1810 family)